MKKYQTLIVFLLAIFWTTCLQAYGIQIQIEKGPALDAGPNTFIAKHSPQEGEPLISWLGGAENIEEILIGTPYINLNQVNFTEEYVRRRFENSVCVNSKKNAWHYAPFTMGTIYFSNGDKINFKMYLSGITIAGNLFAETVTTKEWNDTYYRLNNLSDKEVQGFLQSQNDNEKKVAALILKIRASQRNWEFYRKRLEKYSYKELISALGSSNSTEVEVAISNLTTKHREKQKELIPLFVQYANQHTEHKNCACWSFIDAVGELTGKDFHTRYDGPTTKQCLNKLNSWWDRNKDRFINTQK